MGCFGEDCLGAMLIGDAHHVASVAGGEVEDGLPQANHEVLSLSRDQLLAQQFSGLISASSSLSPGDAGGSGLSHPCFGRSYHPVGQSNPTPAADSAPQDTVEGEAIAGRGGQQPRVESQIAELQAGDGPVLQETGTAEQ